MSWAREMRSLAACTVRPPPFPNDAPQGNRHTVLVIPGFMAGDWTTFRLRMFLRSLGYGVETAGVHFNAGPTAGLLKRLDRTLRDLTADGTRVSIVGQSLGGVLARSLARRHQESVRCVITLCSPIRFPVVTPLQPFAAMLTPFHSKTWLAERDEVALSPGVPVTALYSRDDGIVDWRQCLQDESDGCINVEVRGSHSTVGSNPEAQKALAIALSA